MQSGGRETGWIKLDCWIQNLLQSSNKNSEVKIKKQTSPGTYNNLLLLTKYTFTYILLEYLVKKYKENLIFMRYQLHALASLGTRIEA